MDRPGDVGVPGPAWSTGSHHEEFIAVELRVGVPDVDLTLDIVRQLLRVCFFAVTVAEFRHVLLEWTVVVVPPRRRRQREVVHRLIAAFLDDGEERRDVADRGILPRPEGRALWRRVSLHPAHLGHGHVSPRDEQPAPIAEGGLHAHDRDGALAPDEVERTGREVQPLHVSNTGFDPVPQPRSSTWLSGPMPGTSARALSVLAASPRSLTGQPTEQLEEQ